MKDVFIKLRMGFFIFRLLLMSLVAKIKAPFQIAIELTKRYLALRKIDKESKDGWERYVKRRELERKDELALRREQFQLLKIQLIGAFFRTGIFARICVALQEQPNEVDDPRKDFQTNKEELVALLEKLCNYDEITFDEKIKSAIISWDFETFETQEELTNWGNSFSKYICTLDIV